MRKIATRQKIHHGDFADGDRGNRRKVNRCKGLWEINDSRGESSGDTTVPVFGEDRAGLDWQNHKRAE